MVILKQVGKWRWVVLAGIILIAIFMLTKSCGDSEGEYWKGQYDSLKEMADVERDIRLADIANQNRYIGQIEAANILLIETRIRQERRIGVLEFERQDLVTNEPSQPELEIEPLVVNLREQINKMSMIIRSQELVIQGNDKIVFNLVEKYEAQLIISEDYKELYEMEQGLHSLAVKRLSVTENRIRGLRFGHQLKNAGFVIVIGTLIYVIAN